jgi:TPR repeat protein
MDSWKSDTRYKSVVKTDELQNKYWDDNQRTDNFHNTLLIASKGDPDAQYSLGVMYSKGVGIEKNDVLAHYWYWEATKKGHSLAQSVVGKMCIEKEKFRAERQSKLAFMLFCADNKELDKDVLSILWNKLKTDEDRIDELRKYTRLALDKLK